LLNRIHGKERLQALSSEEKKANVREALEKAGFHDAAKQVAAFLKRARTEAGSSPGKIEIRSAF
jgi:hypothetical protein